MCIGPVGLAETYSTLTRVPCPDRSSGHSRRRRAGSCAVRRATPRAVRRMLMKPGPAISALSISGSSRELRRDQLGERARVGLRRLGQHHRRVGREIAMRRIARRLDRDVAAIEPGGQIAGGFERVEVWRRCVGEAGVEGQGDLPMWFGAASSGKPARIQLPLPPVSSEVETRLERAEKPVVGLRCAQRPSIAREGPATPPRPDRPGRSARDSGRWRSDRSCRR